MMAVASSVLVILALASVPLAGAEEYDAMKGVGSARAIFDMRDGVPRIAAVHMKLIYDTYRELAAMEKDPDFVVVFIGGAVRLISSSREQFSSQERKHLQEIDAAISKMCASGIRMEVCLAAVNYFEPKLSDS